jgi:hypothetical protein
MPVVPGASTPSQLEYIPVKPMHISPTAIRERSYRINIQWFEVNARSGELTLTEETQMSSTGENRTVLNGLKTIVTQARVKIKNY